MAQGVLHVALRYFRRTIQSQEVRVLTDGQLLDRFLQKRDDLAFSTLVERHAALVLTVAGRVLHDLHEAEDVFQATFFVLARKAGTIAHRPTVAGWLYQVAYHLALKAKAEKARQRDHERRPAPMTQAAPDININRDELRSVLDQELSRLPEKYRTPLVLHYLEGKSKNETAVDLGWTEGTVSGRLARGREILRSRLVRRGFILSSTSITTALAKTAATAAVAPQLLSATTQTALIFAQGGSIASSTAAHLAEGFVNTLVMAKMKHLAFLVALVALVAAGAGALAYQCLADNTDAGIQILSRPEPEHQQPAAAKNRVAEFPESSDAPLRLSASGKVVDIQGKAIVGATVYLREIALLRDRAALQQQEGYTDILAQATTDSTGRFTFKDVATPSMKLSPSNAYRFPWNLVVTSKGHGLAWHTFRSHSEEDLTIVLRPEASLSGRLLDSTGRPAAGIRVQLNTIDDELNPDPRKRRFSEERLQLVFSRLPLAAVTDGDGRFVMNGLPRGFHIGLNAEHPRFARKWLNCATLDHAQIERLNAPPSVPAESKLLADGFIAALEASGSVQGRVAYADTGKPTVGARVNMGIFASVTDAEGRYSFQGVDGRNWRISVAPPEGSDYLGADADVVVSANTLVREQDFKLERGVVITGELRDRETEQPLRVPHLLILYQSETKPPAHAGAGTQADGSFRIVVPAGKGKLFTYEQVPGSVPRDIDFRDRADAVTLSLVIKPGETLTGQHLLFQRGMTVQGRVLDAQGTPVAGAVFHGVTEQKPSGPDGAFTLRGLSLVHKSNFLVLHGPRSLGVKLAIEPSKDPKPVIMDVKLKPTESVKARVVDENKRPVANARVDLVANIGMTETPKSYSYRPLPVYGPVPTDAAGNYVLPALVLDGSYTVKASVPGSATAQEHFRVEAGKNTTIPDLVLLGSNLVIGGVVVDPAGRPIEGVAVRIIARNSTVADNYHSAKTMKDGRFHFHGLPKAEYRLIVDLWKPTGKTDKDGRPAHTREAGTELRAESGQENIRVILHLPQETNSPALAGKPAPHFGVAKWLNPEGGKPAGFKVEDHRGRVLLLAFLDEARPSERLVKQLNELRERYSAKGLTIVRIYETPVAEPELTKLSPTPAALVTPGLVAGGYGEAAQKYSVRETPTLFLIDRQGIVRHADLEADSLQQRIEELLAK